MKAFLKFLLGALLGSLLGWVLGYLHFPTIESEEGLLLGFIGGGSLQLLLLALYRIATGQALLLRPFAGSTPKASSLTRIAMALGLLFVVGSGAAALWLYQQNATLKAQNEALRTDFQAQASLMAGIRKENQSAAIANILAKLDAELAANPGGTLSPSLIDRITNLTADLLPYRYYTGDSLADAAFSPERGQLFLTLCTMPIDSASMAQILSQADFTAADLHGANLAGKQLGTAKLRGANLREADLRGTNFQKADLSFANLWGANLDSADLRGTNLRRARLGWAEINAADLRKANLNGADLRNAKFRGSNLTGALCQWTNAEGTIFRDALLIHVDLVGSKLRTANFAAADLTEANIMATDLTDVNLGSARLDHTSCAPDFMDHLDEWRIPEANKIRQDFIVTDDTAKKFVTTLFCLIKKPH